MTEEEAKAKWCPFGRVVGTAGGYPPIGQPVFNRAQEQGEVSAVPVGPCIASACMAWRWDGTHVNDPDDPKGDLVWSDRSYGHCGLAGEQTPGRAISLESRRRDAEAPQ